MTEELRRRVYYAEAFWRAHHEAWKRSELNQREYCEAECISLKAFGNWRAKFKSEPQPPQRKLLYRRGGSSHTLSHSWSHTLVMCLPRGYGAALRNGHIVSDSNSAPHSNNPRTHDRAQRKKLKKLIERLGLGAPPVIDENFIILAGHACTGKTEEMPLFLPVMRQVFAQPQEPGRR
jgi:hypothetical protein